MFNTAVFLNQTSLFCDEQIILQITNNCQQILFKKTLILSKLGKEISREIWKIVGFMPIK